MNEEATRMCITEGSVNVAQETDCSERIQEFPLYDLFINFF